MQQPIHSNPYAPPEAPQSLVPHEPERYEFKVEVLEADVHRATRRLGHFFVGFCFLGGALLVSLLVILTGFFSGNLAPLLYFVPTSVFFLIAMTRMAWLHLGPGIGRLRVRTTPLIVGPIEGSITDAEIRISSQTSTEIYPLKSCCYAEVRADTLVFAFDQRRLLLNVLPRRAFAAGCFERAAKLLIQHAVASQASPADGVIDQRLQADEFYPIDLPTDGVPFSGAITSRDVLASPLREQASKIRWMLMGAIIFVLLLLLAVVVPLYDKLRFEFGLILFVIFLFLILRIWGTYRRNLDWTQTPDQVLLRSRGVISQQSLHASTPAGATIYRWDAFTEATIQKGLISLALPGKLGHRVLLSRSQFATDSDWSQAQAIIREQTRYFPTIENT